MKHFYCTIPIILCALLCTITTIAQENKKHDLNSWWHIELDIEVHEKLELSIRESIRLENNSKQTKSIFTEFGVKYSPIKQIDIATKFRVINSKKKDHFDLNLRHNVDFSYKHPLNNFRFIHRIRYVNRNELGRRIAEGDDIVHQFRLLTSLAYKTKKSNFTPKIAAELFNRFVKNEPAIVEKIRLRLEGEYAFKKAGKIGFFFGYERYFNEPVLKNISIIGVNYNYTIKTWKKTDKTLQQDD